MRKTKAQLQEMAKNTIGAPVVILELDPKIEDTAFEQALMKYEEYFVAHRYSTLNVSTTQRVYDVSLPTELTTYENKVIGKVLAGQTTASTDMTITNLPVYKGSLTITVGGVTGTDNGEGVIAGTGISGTINYTQGKVVITLDSQVGADTNVLASYGVATGNDLYVKDVLNVYSLNPYFNTVWTQYGLLDLPSFVMADYIMMPADFYKTMQAIDETSFLLGSEIDFEYVSGKLYLRSFQNGRVTLRVRIDMTVSDVQDEHSSRFLDLLVGYLKIALGHVRRKYPTVPVPGGEIQLDGDALISEGEAKVKEVEDKFKLLQNRAVIIQA